MGIVYKQMRTKSMSGCSNICGQDVDCKAFGWDHSFGECSLYKQDLQTLERQTMKAQNQVVKEAGNAAEQQAADIEQAEEAEKKKEAKDAKKIEDTPIKELEEKPTPRDLWRSALRKEKEAKKLVTDSDEAHKETHEKVVGTATVERIAKRHEQESGAKL